jgi:hypothetical protein
MEVFSLIDQSIPCISFAGYLDFGWVLAIHLYAHTNPSITVAQQMTGYSMDTE